MFRYDRDVQCIRDEVEKSIVAKLADEIIIGSGNNYVEVVIYKNFDHK